ncbi:Hypothetical protein NTJ_14507 [Nesidiocoris tenuis]|uniref:Uncharacterized protein n=1 Tax=Nesidiocoris tenuis TaxID=355587 RepID=A0ABN7BBC9_9HEMI|nr:Hypothetical protein NTJ_14507 [Nesidiocoris tenuis]
MRSIFLVFLLVALTQALEPKDDPIKKLLKVAELSQKQNSFSNLDKNDGKTPTADISCDLQKLSQDATDYIITAVKMMNQIFKLSYQAYTNKSDCPFSSDFRCFLKRYTDLMSVVNKVKSEIVSFSKGSPGFFTDILNCKSSLVNH